MLVAVSQIPPPYSTDSPGSPAWANLRDEVVDAIKDISLLRVLDVALWMYGERS